MMLKHIWDNDFLWSDEVLLPEFLFVFSTVLFLYSVWILANQLDCKLFREMMWLGQKSYFITFYVIVKAIKNVFI